MTTVTKESLTTRIAELEAGPRSLKEDYYLAVCEMLIAVIEQKPICYLTWHQGCRAPDDCEDYVLEAAPGDLSCDGTPAFAVFPNRMLPNRN